MWLCSDFGIINLPGGVGAAKTDPGVQAYRSLIFGLPAARQYFIGMAITYPFEVGLRSMST